MGDTLDYGQNNQNNQNEVYLSLLEKSLEKKAVYLEELIELTGEQETLIAAGELEGERFNSIYDRKTELIEKIDELDRGFEQIYQRVKDELASNTGSYRSKIEELKELITDVTDRGVRLQVMERRNRDKIENYLRDKRDSIRNFKVNSKTASKYYSSFNKMGKDSSYFFDEKK